jgi:hypothetical protein
MTKKTTYAVQWHDEEEKRWRISEGSESITITQGLSELDLHKDLYPSIGARLVEIETITTVHPLTLTDPKDS